jgi:FkbM family methyltransferase
MNILTNVKRSTKELTISIRPNTTDEKVVKEVLQQVVYEKPSIGFFIETGETWLDLGSNIGTFSLLALTRGAKVFAYEPEPENYSLTCKNVEKNFGQTTSFSAFQQAVHTQDGVANLYLCKGDYNKYRHTLYPKRGRTVLPVSQIGIKSILQKHKNIENIKMDIEGIEIDLLEHLTLEDYQEFNIRKMVIEYSFDIDASIPRFIKIMDCLKKYFPHVHWTKVKENEEFYHYFPAATLVFCYF